MTAAIELVRVVLDTNVLVRALGNPDSASGQLVEACEARRGIALLSKPLFAEYRRVLARAAETREIITLEALEGVLSELRYFGEYLPHITARFFYPRDRTDEKLIELAIEARATHIASYDAGLLTLPTSRSESGKRFRQRLRDVVVAKPDAILRRRPDLLPRENL